MPSSACQTCARSEEHTSELQSHSHLVCRLLLEKKKNHETGAGTSQATAVYNHTKKTQVWRSVSTTVALTFVDTGLCPCPTVRFIFFFFNDPGTTEIYPLSLPAALPI